MKNKRHTLLYDLWSQATVHSRVLPQSICPHTQDSWSVIDANLAICNTCGLFHICKDSFSCPLVYNDDGYPICTITACQVDSLVQSQMEYIDTVGPMEATSNHQQQHQQQQQRGKQCLSSIPRDNLSSIVHSHCHNLLCGDKWEQCTKTETEKACSRKRTSLYKYLKDFKIKNQGKMPNMALAACAMLNQSRGTRNLPNVSR
jgi:hypothetical protein